MFVLSSNTLYTVQGDVMAHTLHVTGEKNLCCPIINKCKDVYVNVILSAVVLLKWLVPPSSEGIKNTVCLMFTNISLNLDDLITN